MTEAINQDTGPKVVAPTAIGGGSLKSPGAGYPPAPSFNEPVSHAQQGFVVMTACVNCNRAFAPTELGAHMQEENESPFRSNGAPFGRAEL